MTWNNKVRTFSIPTVRLVISVCKLIIDGRSIANAASALLVTKLQLSTLKTPSSHISCKG